MLIRGLEGYPSSGSAGKKKKKNLGAKGEASSGTKD